MKEIDFLEKKEALNKEMLKYIEDGVKILGGTADIHRMVGYAVVSLDGHETTKEICINEVEIKQGILRFHDANAIDWDCGWYAFDELLWCSMDSVCDSIQRLLNVMSSNESFAEDKREEFTDFVEKVFPGYGSRIDWDYFDNIDTMENNLMAQVHWWMEEQ